jgi:uncharacterized damage-inducible protein DinB
MKTPPDLFLGASRRYLTHELHPRIVASVERLPPEDIWWRPNPSSNSIGNLLLHLSGNLRQWIVAGVGGEADTRDREREFTIREPLPAAELLERLGETVRAADSVLAALDPARLTDEVHIQGRNATVLEAIYHAVEHFSMHTGQITYVTKLRTGEDLGFYELVDGIPRARWATPEDP